mgnify:FL=1
MAGQTWGLIESFHAGGGGAPDTTRSLAAAIIAALTHAANGGAGPVERIAANYGRLDASNGAAGFGLLSSGTPIGHDGFAVFRLKPNAGRAYSIYFLLQWGTSTYQLGARTTTVGGIPRVDPAKWTAYASQGNALGLSVAIALTSGGADANPWTGTTRNDGTDTKCATPGSAGPVWAAPAGGTLFVWPRSNAIGGSHATNRENLMSLIDVQSTVGAGSCRLNVEGDDDHVVFEFDAANDGTYHVTRIFDLTLTADNNCPIHHAVWQDVSGTAITSGQTNGSTTGHTGFEGGVPGWNGSAYQVLNAMQSFDERFSSTTFQPSAQRTVGGATASTFDTFPDVAIGANEATMYGLVGRAKGFMPLVFNMNVHDRNAALTQVAIAPTTTLSNARYMVPWDGATPPQSGVTPAGVTFRR